MYNQFYLLLIIYMELKCEESITYISIALHFPYFH